MQIDDSEVTVTVLDARQAMRHVHSVWICFREVFDDAPTFDEWSEKVFACHVGRVGFRLVLATRNRRVIGFAWGYRGDHGQYWTDLVAQQLPGDVAAEWLGVHFEFAELGVVPAERGHGLAQRLHDELLDGLDGRCLLSTSADLQDPAVRLYRRNGWRRIGALGAAAQVMGVDLRKGGALQA